ncbi:unnamed protein product [Chrysoparadoxa australica]
MRGLWGLRRAVAGHRRWVPTQALRPHSTSLKEIAEEDEKEIFSRHRNIMNLYELNGNIAPTCWVAPNATVVGDVCLVDKTSIWYGAVVRGDRKSIVLGGYVSVGDKAVLSTVGKLSTGFPADIVVGDYTVIEPGAVLTSCRVGYMCVVGAGAVVGTGCIMRPGSSLQPGSVLPNNTLIPAEEEWGGNPAKKIGKSDPEANMLYAESLYDQMCEHQNEFEPHGMSFKEAEKLRARGHHI